MKSEVFNIDCMIGKFKKGNIVNIKSPKHSWYKKIKLTKRYIPGYWYFRAIDGFKGFGTISENDIESL